MTGIGKMIITIDLDNTLLNSHETFKTFCDKYNYPLYLPIKDWHFNDQTPETKHFLNEAIVSDKISETLFDGKIWNKKIPRILEILSEKHTIYFISSRSTNMQHKTKIQLLENNIKLAKIKVLCTGNISKIDTLKAFKTNLHIDDAPNIIEECISNNIPHIMYSNEMTPYNHHLRSKANHYVNTWEKILKMVLLFEQNGVL